MFGGNKQFLFFFVCGVSTESEKRTHLTVILPNFRKILIVLVISVESFV